MISSHRLIRALATAFALALAPPALSAQAPLTVSSPDGRTQVTVAVDSGTLRYAVRHAGANVVMPSRLGFAFKGRQFRGEYGVHGSFRSSGIAV